MGEKIDLKVRNKIAQLFVDMSVGESKPVTKQAMVPLLMEVNDTPMIGHAMRFSSENGVVVRVQKYRLTEVERRVERKKEEGDIVEDNFICHRETSGEVKCKGQCTWCQGEH